MTNGPVETIAATAPASPAVRSAAGVTDFRRCEVGSAAATAHGTCAGVFKMPRAFAECVRVREDCVDLPLLACGTGHPHLVLSGEATCRADLFIGEQTLVAQPRDLRMNLLAGLDLDAEMI